MARIHGLASHDGLNFSKKSAAVKPLAGADFGEQLKKRMGAELMLARPGLRPMSELDMISPIKGAIMPLQDLNPPPLTLNPLGDALSDLSRSKPPQSEHERLQATARKLVAQTFYGPMLKAMRESPFKDKLLSGGRGGEAFTSMFDQRLAEHMARSADSKLVRSITRKLENNAAKQTQVTPESTAPAENSNQNVRVHVAPGLRA